MSIRSLRSGPKLVHTSCSNHRRLGRPIGGCICLYRFRGVPLSNERSTYSYDHMVSDCAMTAHPDCGATISCYFMDTRTSYYGHYRA